MQRLFSFTLVQEEIENSLWLTLLAMEIWGTRLLQEFLYGGVPKNQVCFVDEQLARKGIKSLQMVFLKSPCIIIIG